MRWFLVIDQKIGANCCIYRKIKLCKEAFTTGSTIQRVLGNNCEKMVIYDCDQGDSDIRTEVTVTDPIIHYSCGNGRYTTYSITLESNDFCFSLPRSVVRRRFSEFIFLRRLLKILNPNVIPPSLNSRNFFSDRFSSEFIMQRRQQLEKFMQQILSEQLYLSNKAVHLFLQSNLPMREIEAQVTGVLPILPLEENESHLLLSDSSVSTVSSGDSDCHNCDFLDGNTCSNPKCCYLLSTNHEAFVASVPFLPCSNDIHITKEKTLMPKELLHSTESSATSSSYHSSSLSVPQSSNRTESSPLCKRKVSFAADVTM